MPCQDIVGEGKPAQNGENFVAASKCELAQAPITEAGVDAFAWRSTLVDALAVRALHPPAPSHQTESPGRVGQQLNYFRSTP